MKCKKALALLLAAVLTAGIPAGCASSASSGSERRLGSFQAVTLDGGTFTQADIAGKDVTIINFWGPSAPPASRRCRTWRPSPRPCRTMCS